MLVNIEIIKSHWDLPIKDDKISCGSCLGKAACCRDMVMPLSESEAAQMQEAGTELEMLSKDQVHGERPGRKKDFYAMTGKCANLNDEGQCGIYEERPGACRDFQVGRFTCQLFNVVAEEAANDLQKELVVL